MYALTMTKPAARVRRKFVEEAVAGAVVFLVQLGVFKLAGAAMDWTADQLYEWIYGERASLEARLGEISVEQDALEQERRAVEEKIAALRQAESMV